MIQSAAAEFGTLMVEMEAKQEHSEQPNEQSVKGSLSKALTRREYSREEREERHKKRVYVRNAEYIASVKNRQSETCD